MGSRTVVRRGRVLAAVVVVLGLLAAFVLWWFQPQKLFLDDTVNEAAPAAAAGAAPAVLAEGVLHSGEHHTTGVVRLLDLGDGRTVLRIVDLRTSNGPAVHVWLSAADIRASNEDIDRAGHFDLGGLKGNLGSQNYDVPAEVSGDGFQTVVIWCSRFHVAFGAASLAAV